MILNISILPNYSLSQYSLFFISYFKWCLSIRLNKNTYICFNLLLELLYRTEMKNYCALLLLFLPILNAKRIKYSNKMFGIDLSKNISKADTQVTPWLYLKSCEIWKILQYLLVTSTVLYWQLNVQWFIFSFTNFYLHIRLSVIHCVIHETRLI